jgi:hypothetical protein
MLYMLCVYYIYTLHILQRERQQKLQEAKLKLEADNSDLTFKPEMNDKSLRLAARIAAETHMQVAMRPAATSVWGLSLPVIQLCGRQSLRLAARIAAETHTQRAMRPCVIKLCGLKLRGLQLSRYACGLKSLRLASRIAAKTRMQVH